MNLLKNKKFKYGSVAILLTALILAVILVTNIIVTLVSSHFEWYADISSSKLFSFSSKSLAMFDQIDRKNNELHIYYFSDKNMLEQSPYGNYVLTLTNELENRYADDELFTVHFIEDINRDIFEIGEIFGTRYASLLADMYENKEIAAGTMVIRNNTKEVDENGSFIPGTEDYRISVFSITDMYSGTTFLGDYLLTARILGVCHLSPTVYFMTGHDEMPVGTDRNYGNAEYLAELFDSCGFKVEKLYLSQGDFAKSHSGSAMAVIFAPRIDYTKAELDKLSAFVKNGGHLMMFADSVQRKLDNLGAFLADYGIRIVNDKFKSGLDSSLSLGDYTFICDYDKKNSLLGTAIDSTERAVVSDARVLQIDKTKGANALLLAPDSAVLNSTGGAVKKDQAIAAYSTASGRGGVFVCGASSFVSSLVYTPDCANRDILFALMGDMGAESLPLNIKVKSLATDGLDLTRQDAILLSVIVSAVPALLMVALGTFVYVRRKRS